MPARRRPGRRLLALAALVAVLIGARYGIRILTASDTLPHLAGQNLKDAEHAADAAGFSHLRTHDASGGDRAIMMDSHWLVCFQTPAPGSHDTAATVDLGAVKTGESCPANDQSTIHHAPNGTMPDLRGDSLAAAPTALPSHTRITRSDATGRGRAVLWADHWKICTQAPGPGTPLASRTVVSLRVVKLTETCPSSP